MDGRVLAAGGTLLALGLVMTAVTLAGKKPAVKAVWTNSLIPGRRYRFVEDKGGLSDDMLRQTLNPTVGWSDVLWWRTLPADWPAGVPAGMQKPLYVEATWTGSAQVLSDTVQLWMVG